MDGNQESAVINVPKVNTEPKIVKTDIDSKDGQNKCPKCGATDISLNVNTGKLRCNYCRHEYSEKDDLGFEIEIEDLEGQIMGSGVLDIKADVNDVLTFKCSSCGSEVIIDTASSTQARCHWCRNTLSVNQQIPNGTIPDMLLPFQLPKDVAQKQIREFVKKRKFFANPKFKREFTTDNIMGVYFPYIVVDVNSHANYSGQGEVQTREYTVGSGENRETYYEADLYNVEREFDLTINGLTVESNSDRLDTKSKAKTNNIINSIMPFDIENCVKYNANYLKGYTSETRDTNVEQLRSLVETQAKDIARYAANETLLQYDRGVNWSKEEFSVKGQQWKAAYLPVWLYSYQQVNGSKKLLHYVAVNARTKETMGSVPIHMPKLLLISTILEIIGLIVMFFTAALFTDFDYSWIFALTGFLFFFSIIAKYRNSGARHSYEMETKKEIDDVRKVDIFVENRKRLKNRQIPGANNMRIDGKVVKKDAAQFFNDLNTNGLK